jgi:hypothetical protein
MAEARELIACVNRISVGSFFADMSSDACPIWLGIAMATLGTLVAYVIGYGRASPLNAICSASIDQPRLPGLALGEEADLNGIEGALALGVMTFVHWTLSKLSREVLTLDDQEAVGTASALAA